MVAVTRACLLARCVSGTRRLAAPCARHDGSQVALPTTSPPKPAAPGARRASTRYMCARPACAAACARRARNACRTRAARGSVQSAAVRGAYDARARTSTHRAPHLGRTRTFCRQRNACCARRFFSCSLSFRSRSSPLPASSPSSRSEAIPHAWHAPLARRRSIQRDRMLSGAGDASSARPSRQNPLFAAHACKPSGGRAAALDSHAGPAAYAGQDTVRRKRGAGPACAAATSQRFRVANQRSRAVPREIPRQLAWRAAALSQFDRSRQVLPTVGTFSFDALHSLHCSPRGRLPQPFTPRP